MPAPARQPRPAIRTRCSRLPFRLLTDVVWRRHERAIGDDIWGDPRPFLSVVVRHRALRALSVSELAPGNLFCEWGSGFGVVACLAAMLDFDACGIEPDEEAVTGALFGRYARRGAVLVDLPRGR